MGAGEVLTVLDFSQGQTQNIETLQNDTAAAGAEAGERQRQTLTEHLDCA